MSHEAGGEHQECDHLPCRRSVDSWNKWRKCCGESQHQVCSEEESSQRDHDPQTAKPGGDADEPCGPAQKVVGVTFLPNLVVRIARLGNGPYGFHQVQRLGGNPDLETDHEAWYQEEQGDARDKGSEGHYDSPWKMPTSGGVGKGTY